MVTQQESRSWDLTWPGKPQHLHPFPGDGSREGPPGGSWHGSGWYVCPRAPDGCSFPFLMTPTPADILVLADCPEMHGGGLSGSVTHS